MTQGKYLLEFDVEFAENDNLKYDDLKALDIDEQHGYEFSVDIIKKNELEYKLFEFNNSLMKSNRTRLLLIRPLLAKMNGLAKVNKTDHLIKIKFE